MTHAKAAKTSFYQLPSEQHHETFSYFSMNDHLQLNIALIGGFSCFFSCAFLIHIGTLTFFFGDSLHPDSKPHLYAGSYSSNCGHILWQQLARVSNVG